MLCHECSVNISNSFTSFVNSIMADITLPEQRTLSYMPSLQDRVLTPQTVALGKGRGVE